MPSFQQFDPHLAGWGGPLGEFDVLPTSPGPWIWTPGHVLDMLSSGTKLEIQAGGAGDKRKKNSLYLAVLLFFFFFWEFGLNFCIYFYFFIFNYLHWAGLLGIVHCGSNFFFFFWVVLHWAGRLVMGLKIFWSLQWISVFTFFFFFWLIYIGLTGW